jgi:phosphopantothenoylcysteine decarboxylase/phosphopantothenate--cysteine ligase
MKSTVVLGVTGSVAAYRAADVARELMRHGFSVKCCLTRSAAELVTPALFEALTGNPCVTDVFDEPVRGRMAHIDIAREASVVLVCPATANAIAVLAAGNAVDMFSTIVSATGAPLLIAPAMNPEMYASAANQENLSTLRRRGACVIEPDDGVVACGEQGQGKLAATASIVAATMEAAFRSHLYDGVRIVVTAGPTHETIDPVRHIANRSSGKMGYAIARAAIQMGASVTLVAGPTHIAPPPAATLVRVTSAEEMLSAATAACEGADLLIGAAAVADFRPSAVSREKVRSGSELALTLIPTQDILAAVRSTHPGIAIVGFAAETTDHLASAKEKIERKGLAAIAINDVSDPSIGFDSEENALEVLFADGHSVSIARDSKFNVAARLLESIRPLVKK